MPQSKPPPTASAFAQNARLLRLPLKGGVDLIFSLVKNDLRRGRIPAFWAAPLRPDSIPHLPSGFPTLARGVHFPAIAVAGFSRRWGMLERPPVCFWVFTQRGAHHALPAFGRNSLRLVRNQRAFARNCRPRGFGEFGYDVGAGRFARKYRISIKFHKYR